MSVRYLLKPPENFAVSLESDTIKKLSLGDLKTRSFPEVSLNYTQIYELSRFVPYMSLSSQERGKMTLELGKEGIEVEIRYRSELSFTIGGKKEEEKPVDNDKLKELSYDANLIVGVLLGRLGLKNEDVKAEFSCRFRKNHIFEKGFNKHFNQSFLAKLKIIEVSEIEVQAEDSFAGIPSLVVYDLVKGEKEDRVNVTSKFNSFASVALDLYVNEALKKANEMIVSTGDNQ